MLSGESDRLLAWARKRQPEIVAFIRELVECESPSDSPADLRRFNELLADSLQGEAVVSKKQTHLLCRYRFSKNAKRTQILALGHSDTVWPLGTLQTMPFRRAKGRLWGPGV
ncbi:MAG: M20 family peptidase, partial [Terriglobia bacterium]